MLTKTLLQKNPVRSLVSYTFTKRVDSAADDGVWLPGINIFPNAAAFGTADAQYNTYVRFTSVTVPKGATITGSKLTFVASNQGPQGNDPHVTVQVVDNVNPSAPTTLTDCNNLTYIGSVGWDPPVWTQETIYDSPDFKSQIQTLVDNANWVSGNSLMVCVIGSTTIVNYHNRNWYDYGNSTTKAPLLTINYQA